MDIISFFEQVVNREVDSDMSVEQEVYAEDFQMLRLSQDHPTLRVVFDQIGTPTYAADLAGAIFAVLESEQWHAGIYHFTDEGVCSWFDFTKMIAMLSGHNDCDIQPCHSDEFPSPVTRPSYSVFDKTKVKETFGVKVPYWTDSLKIWKEEIRITWRLSTIEVITVVPVRL